MMLMGLILKHLLAPFDAALLEELHSALNLVEKQLFVKAALLKPVTAKFNKTKYQNMSTECYTQNMV